MLNLDNVYPRKAFHSDAVNAVQSENNSNVNKSENLTNGSFTVICHLPHNFSENLELSASCCKNEIKCSDPAYYGFFYGVIGTIFQSSVFLVGVSGNLVVLVTVRGTKSLHTTTNCYLVSLAVADLITLVSSVPQV